MNKKIIAVILAIILIGPVSSFAGYYWSSQRKQPENKTLLSLATELPPFSCSNISALNNGTANLGINTIYNVSQGTALRVNLTYTPTYFASEKYVIPIRNVTLCYYNSVVNLNGFTGSNESYSTIQSEAFNYSFSLNPIVILPNTVTSNSTILTINFSNDAPLGQYTMGIYTDKIVENNVPYVDSIEFNLFVTPRTTLENTS